MSVIVGSARSNEFGDISGGSAGDQLQSTVPDFSGECSMQEWYLHPKGWVVARAKDPEVREKIAQNMENICNNPNYGYDQPRDQDGTRAAKQYGYDASKVKTPTSTDCARAVRLCILYAGVNVADFYTVTEMSAIKATGQFDILTDSRYAESEDYLLRGDILCTKVKGHTVVILSDGKLAKGSADVYETTGNVYMRTGPSVSYSPIQVVPKGRKVTGSEMTDGWLACEYNGKKGYCSVKYLTPITSETYSYAELSGNAHLRSNAGVFNKSLKVVKRSESVKLTGVSKKVLTTTWHECVHFGTTGWISGKYLVLCT